MPNALTTLWMASKICRGSPVCRKQHISVHSRRAIQDSQHRSGLSGYHCKDSNFSKVSYNK